MLADVASAETRRATWLRRWWAGAALALFAATWKLWTPQTEFPQVPLFGWAGSLPLACDRIALGVWLGSLASSAWWPDSRRSWIMVAASLLMLMVLDQHRLQPWAWQLFLMAIVWLAARSDESPERTARLLRVLTISIYFWSAVSKVDSEFFVSHGPTLVVALFGAVGIDVTQWPAFRGWFAVCLPLGELLVAIGLCWRRTRRCGLIAAIGLHVGLLLALGPLGLGHRPGVLIWNVAFIGHVWLLFGTSSFVVPPSRGVTPSSENRWKVERTTIVIAFACLWPITQSLGWCDRWLAWSVYVAQSERVSVTMTEEGVRRLPESARRSVADGELLLDRWSLTALEAPIYPQLRFQFGVVEWLRQRCGDENLVEVTVLRGVSGIERLTGEEVEKRNAEFWVNTRPRY
jgi:hypothetical protein